MLSSIIVTAMLLSSIGLTAFAEDSAIVAKVDWEKESYTVIITTM